MGAVVIVVVVVVVVIFAVSIADLIRSYNEFFHSHSHIQASFNTMRFKFKDSESRFCGERCQSFVLEKLPL